MSTPSGPFEGGPFGDLMRHLAQFFTGQGPLNWEIARQMAQWAAAGGQPEPNPDPLSRVRLEELTRVADLHVSEATGMQATSGGLLSVRAVAPSEWAMRTLDAWKAPLEKLAAKMTPTGPPGSEGPRPPGAWFSGGEAEGAAEEDPMARLFGTLPQVLGPFLFGLQAGSMVGQLASRAMGQYDLPMPRPHGDELMLVPSTIDRFATDWSLQLDDVRMWICLRETTNHVVLSRPHVRARLDQLIGEYVDAFSPTSAALEERLADVDLTDMAGLQAAFGDPETVLGEMQNDAQRQIQRPLQTILAAVVGYVDHVMDSVGRRLIGSYGPLTEALRRRRLEDTAGSRVLGQLLGVSLGAEQYEQGQAFVRGVLERAGEDGLTKLWRSERELPTPAELTAPGLWLARIELPEEPSAG
jgi:putative hydrolase